MHVVFRKPATAAALAPGRGAPASATLASLAALDENDTVLFGRRNLQQKLHRAAGLEARAAPVDLGETREVAKVRVNGKLAGTGWHAPYRVDIGAMARPSRNRIEVRVATCGVNRLIGDAQPGAPKITWTAPSTDRADAPLRRSGLIGPVRLEAVR